MYKFGCTGLLQIISIQLQKLIYSMTPVIKWYVNNIYNWWTNLMPQTVCKLLPHNQTKLATKRLCERQYQYRSWIEAAAQ